MPSVIPSRLARLLLAGAALALTSGIASAGTKAYVGNFADNTVSVIDTTAGKVVKTVEVGKAPNGIALTPDGKPLLVTVYGEDRVGFLDVTTQAVVATVAVPKPHTVAIAGSLIGI